MSHRPVINERIDDDRPIDSGEEKAPFQYESNRKVVNREKRRFKEEFRQFCEELGIDFETNWNAYCARMKAKGWRP